MGAEGPGSGGDEVMARQGNKGTRRYGGAVMVTLAFAEVMGYTVSPGTSKQGRVEHVG